MRFELLADHPELTGLIARWLFSEWGDPALGQSPKQLAERLRSRMSRDSLPMHLIAFDDAVPVGFVALKLYELDSYPDRKFWLGSLFVPPEERGRGIGGALINEVIRRCPAHGVDHLSLQTERLDGGIYRRHGWTEVEKCVSRGDEVLIMERQIGGSIGNDSVAHQ